MSSDEKNTGTPRRAHARHAAATTGSTTGSGGSHFASSGATGTSSHAKAAVPAATATTGARKAEPKARPSARTAGTTGAFKMQGTISIDAEALQRAAAQQAAERAAVVPPSATGSFSQISSAEGAVVTTRATASTAASAATERLKDDGGPSRMSSASRRKLSVKRHTQKTEVNKKLFIGLALAALSVIVAGFILVGRAVNSATRSTTDATGESTEVVAATDDKVTYAGREFWLEQVDGGSWTLVCAADEESDPVSCATLGGTPVCLIRYEEAFLIPQNLGDGTWNVIAYTYADGSVPMVYEDAEGNEVAGEGELASAELDGSNLVLTDADGNVTTVAL